MYMHMYIEHAYRKQETGPVDWFSGWARRINQETAHSPGLGGAGQLFG